MSASQTATTEAAIVKATIVEAATVEDYLQQALVSASRIDDVSTDTVIKDINKVGILGAGTMGGGIAMNFLSAGIDVILVEREQSALDRGTEIIKKNYARSVQRGRLNESQMTDAMSHLNPTLDYTELAGCDLIIEAVFENMEVKKSVFRQLDEIAKPGAILASNTSYLSIDEMAAETSRPEAVLGLHFFSPANIMKLLEIVRGAHTSKAALATAMQLAQRINKVAVVAGVCFGFIGNRMLAPRQRQAQALMMEGAKPWEIDKALTEFGMPMGPFQMSDLAGLDLGWNKESSRSETIRDILCERDRRGQKSGKGYYDYDDNRKPSPSAEVEAIIDGFVKANGQSPRTIAAEEIVERLLYPMINEGALILEEGMAQRASDIDLVWINGYGWPKATGGPMYWANTIGLNMVLQGLEKHRTRLGENFKLSTLLQSLASEGKPFHDTSSSEGF